MKMGTKNALCCFLLLVLVFGACFHQPFISFCCSLLFFLVFEIESILSQKPKQVYAFCCSLWLFVARFGYLWMFPFARCGFLFVRKTKTSNKRQKMSKWKPGLRLNNLLLKHEISEQQINPKVSSVASSCHYNGNSKNGKNRLKTNAHPS